MGPDEKMMKKNQKKEHKEMGKIFKEYSSNDLKIKVIFLISSDRWSFVYRGAAMREQCEPCLLKLYRCYLELESSQLEAEQQRPVF